MFCPGVLQIPPTGLMCPSPRHLIFLLCSLYYFLFCLCIFLNIGLPSFPIAVLRPLNHLHRLGVFKLGFAQSLNVCILRSPKVAWSKKGAAPFYPPWAFLHSSVFLFRRVFSMVSLYGDALGHFQYVRPQTET